MTLKEFIALGVILVIVFVGLVLGLGQFIEGNYTEATPAGDGCYTITVKHTNWYPSNDEIVSRRLICDK